jgi:hypothetical protein
VDFSLLFLLLAQGACHLKSFYVSAGYYGKYNFINGTSPFILTLPTSSVTEGSVLIFRNLDSNPVTITNVLSGGSPLAANGAASFVYTQYAPGGPIWVSL